MTFYDDSHVQIHQGNSLTIMNQLPEESIQCVVTSPPYWGLRKYDGAQDISEWGCSFGLEPTPEQYVAHTVEFLRGVRRVLKNDGVVFWNVGDSYASTPGLNQEGSTLVGTTITQNQSKGLPKRKFDNLKPKDLCLIPFRVAIAAQEDGWYVRSVVIWSKPNPMPESVKDRPTNSHEYIFIFTKSNRYYWDIDAVREPHQEVSINRMRYGWHGNLCDGHKMSGISDIDKMETCHPNGRNIRSVWEFPTEPFSDWGQTHHLSRVEGDVVSCGMMHIPFPNCPVHGDLFGQAAKQFYGEHEGDLWNHIEHIYNHHVLKQTSDYAPTEKIDASGFPVCNWDCSHPEYCPSATGHSNGDHKTGLVPSTNLPCMPFSEMIYHTDDKLALLWSFVQGLCNAESNILPDEMDAHLQGRMIYRIVDKLSLPIPPMCSCLFYQKTTKKTSHFAVFPTELPKRCIMAASKEGDTILDPFGGSGTTGMVAKSLGRKAILIDASDKYCKLAQKRVQSIPIPMELGV